MNNLHKSQRQPGKSALPSRKTSSHPQLFQPVDEILPDPQCRRDPKDTNEQI
jgi:hypothetical protein